MDLVDIFPATIAVCDLKSLTPEVIDKAKEFIDLNNQVGDLSYDGTYTQEQQLLNKLIFRDIKQEIIGYCLEFARAYSHLVEEIEICNSWGNVIEQGQSIHFHRHVNSYISGAFYLTEGSPFVFHNFAHESLFSVMPALIKEDNYRSRTSLTVPPKPGRLIMFPSGLQHSVLPSQVPSKRYSIAFNTMPLGRIGTPTNLVEYRRD